MATPEDNNPLAEIQRSLANLQKIPPSTLAEGGVAAATKATAGITPTEDPLAEINASLSRINASTVPPLTGSRPPVVGGEFAASPTPVVQAPAGAPAGPNPLDEITASLAKLTGAQAPDAAKPAAVGAVPHPPEEDINLPWTDRLSKRFHEAWNAPGEGVVGRTWGTINAPIISETDLESWLGNPTEQFGTLFGGITKGVYSLLGGMTSPLSLGFILGTAGVGGLIEGGAAATLRVAGGMSAGEIATVVKGSQVMAKGIKAGMTSKEAIGAMELAGINSSVVTKGLDILSKAGLTSHDLVKGNLIRTAGAAALRGVGMSTTKAENVGKGIALLIDGGFTADSVYGAAIAWPSALDALKEGDTELAARLITEAAGITGFGLLGAKTFLKDAGGMMDDFQVNMGLKVKPSDENLHLQREFGIADRQMTQAGRTHELWAEDMRKLYKTVTSSPDGPALVRNFVDAGGDEATMQRNYDLILKSAGRQPISDASMLTITPEIAEIPKRRARKTQDTVIPRAATSVPLYESEKYPGGNVSQVFDTYQSASEVLSDQNPYVRLSADPVRSAKSTTNEGRTLLIQISSNLINQNVAAAAEKLKEVAELDNLRPARGVVGEAAEAAAKPELTPDEIAVQYYDKLYSNTRPGYARLQDFWEIPDWIARASHFLPDADLYVVRSVEAAKKFLNDAKYDRVLFSALDVNRDIIKSILYSEDNKSGYSGRVDMGGYIDPTFFKDHPNVNWHDSLETMAGAMGAEYKPGVSYRHFQGSDTIPRLTLSEGCLHKCAFCVLANTALKLSPEDVVNQQVGEIAKLGAKLVYINDKTFGQAKNYQELSNIYEKIKKENPAFHGFAVQTTGAQLNKIPEEWLAKSGIKYVELGIESFNDPILKEMHKPATEQLINKGIEKLRRNNIALIPNIIIGYPGETAATYANTMAFLVKNRDIISHANVYNLAIYKDVELGKKMTTASDGDFNENILEKSWHTDPNVVKTFAGDLYGMLQQHLDQVPDVLQPLRPLSELTPTEIKQLSIGKRAEVFLNVLQQAPEVAELVAAAKAGSKGRDWYDRSIKAFDAMRELAPGYFKPEDADVFAGILAATSPQQSVVMNLREALTFWKEWKDNGSPTTAEEILKLQRKKKMTRLTNQDAKLPNALKAINRETLLPESKEKYFKVGNFARNLQDIAGDPGVTSDSWMGVFFGLDETKVPRASFYHAMAVQTRLAARELGWSPKQAQAAIWSFTKTLSEASGWKGSGEHEKYRPAEVLDFMIPDDYAKYSKDFADLMHEDPEVRAKLHSMGVNVNELDKRLQAIPKPAPVEGANEAATSEILRRTAERIGEAQQKLEGFREYSEYFPGERFDFEREVVERTPEARLRSLLTQYEAMGVPEVRPVIEAIKQNLQDRAGKFWDEAVDAIEHPTTPAQPSRLRFVAGEYFPGERFDFEREVTEPLNKPRSQETEDNLTRYWSTASDRALLHDFSRISDVEGPADLVLASRIKDLLTREPYVHWEHNGYFHDPDIYYSTSAEPKPGYQKMGYEELVNQVRINNKQLALDYDAAYRDLWGDDGAIEREIREAAQTPEGDIRGLTPEESKRWREIIGAVPPEKLRGGAEAEARIEREAQRDIGRKNQDDYYELRKKIGDYHHIGRTDYPGEAKEKAVEKFKQLQKELGTDKVSVDVYQAGSFHEPYHEFTLSEKLGKPRTLAQFEKLWDAAVRADAQAYEAAYKDLWGSDDIDAEIRAARPQTDTPEFKRWFSGSKLVDSEGKPVVLYHGTSSEFTEFSKRKGSPEGDWGAGMYFTNKPEDVNVNYAGRGPDLDRKLEDRASQIMAREGESPVHYGTPEYKVAEEKAKQRARRELGMTHQGAVLPTYLALKNPLELGGPAEPRWDFNDIRKFVSGLKRAGAKAEDFRADRLPLDRLVERGGDKAGAILDELWKDGEGLWDTRDAKGRLVGKEVIRKAIESMGYDGIIDRNVAKKFGNMEGMDENTFHAIAFKPTQVKSATGNLGTFDPTNPDIRADIRVSGFYSPLKRAVVTLPERIGSKNVEKWLLNRGVTKMELEESGLPEWLAGPRRWPERKRTVTKSEIQKFLRENEATVTEKVLGQGPQPLTPQEEMWLNQFQKMERRSRGQFTPKLTPEETQLYDAIKLKLHGGDPAGYEGHLTPFEQGAVPNSYRELIIQSRPAKLKQDYTGRHFPQLGHVLGWLRFDERVAPDGKRVMFLHEVQEGDAVKLLKDHPLAERQQALKNAEAAVEKAKQQLNAALDDFLPGSGITDPREALDRIWTQYTRDRRDRNVSQETLDSYLEEYKVIEKAKDRLTAAETDVLVSRDAIKDAPKIPYSENWFHILLKKALRYAAEQGFDHVAWTSGEHQNQRYNLRQVVSELSYNPEKQILLGYKNGGLVLSRTGITTEKLQEYVGKEVAIKILNAPETKNKPGLRILKGKDLEIGSKGMEGFYGSSKTGALGMVGEFYRGYGKKWGAAIGKTEVPTSEAYDYKKKKVVPKHQPVHSVNITPKMKEEVLGPGQNISKEYAPAKPLEPGNYMMDPKGALHKLAADETHRQWIERNFSDPNAGVDQKRADFDRALEEGYVRVRNEKDGLLIEASKLNPTWAKDVDHIERLSPGDKPVKLDTFQKGSLKQHHFDDPQSFRDWLNLQREAGGPPRGWDAAEPRGDFSRAAEGHHLARFAGAETPAVLDNLSPFVEDKLDRLGNPLGRILDDPNTGQRVAGLFRNERGENTLVLAGKGFEALNRVLKGRLTNLNGGSANAAVSESMVNFLERHPNQYIKDLAAILQPAKGQPITFLMLTGPDPFSTLLHEHVHGALSEAEVSAAHAAISHLPGYDDALTEISGIVGTEGRGYQTEAQIINELLPRLLAGQLLGKGIPDEHIVKMTWEALNALDAQTAYEKILGNIHPNVRGQFDAYIYPERPATERPGVPEQPAAGTQGRGATQPSAAAVPAEQGRGGVRPGDADVQSAPTPASPGAGASVRPLENLQAKLDRAIADRILNVTSPAPVEPPVSKLARALENVKITEGFTVNPATGFVPKTEGFAVEVLPERRLTLKRDITIKDIEAFAEKHKILLSEHPELFVGGYGRELNISAVFQDLQTTKEIGRRLDQEAAWDFAKGQVIDLGGSGKKVDFESFPLSERLELTRAKSIDTSGPSFKIQRELGEVPRDTDEARLHELAAQQHIKAKYSAQEIDALLRSYNPKNLTDQHRALAAEVKKHFNGNFERASAGGALEEGLEHYVTQLWEKEADNPAANRLLADARSGTFAVNTSMARHRTFQHAIEGQLLGRKLAITDPIALAARNGNTFDRVLAARKVLERLQDKGTRASDGRPMVALSGSGKLVQGPDGENEAVIVQADKVRSIRIADKVVEGLRKTGDLDRLIKEGRVVKYGEVKAEGGRKAAEHYAWATHDYRSVEHPSFEGWQFASQDTNGNPVLVRGDLKVHPEAYQFIKRQLETQSPLAKAFAPVFTAGSEAKATLLSFDTFHLVQESLRALMTGVSPFGVERWDLRTNPTLGKLVEHGLNLKSYGPRDTFQEGMLAGYQHSKLLGMIPIAGKISHWFEGFLFDKYIPSLKARAAEHLYGRYKKAYPEYSDSKVAQLAATDTNNRFGGLNLRREGRSLLTQDVFRLVALAPDWMESELRSISRAMGGDGKVMRQDLAKVTIAMWLAARVLNQLNTGNPHYEVPYGVAYKDEEGRDKIIQLRTLPTDMLHSITDPLKFMRYRASPLERTITTVYTGRDSQGRRLPARDLVWDLLANTVIPMPLQNVTQKMSGFTPQRSWGELGLQTAGAQILQAKTEAQQKAMELSADRIESGPVERDKLKEHAVKMEIEDRLRSGSIQPQELWDMVDQDLLSPREAKTIMGNINKTKGMEVSIAKLFLRSARLPMADFLLVWEAANNTEKAALTPLMLKKKTSYFKKAFTEYSAAERQTDATYLKLRKLFPDQPPF